MSKNKKNEATIAARAGIDDEPIHGAVSPPIYLTSNFSFAGYAESRPHDYTRTSNPTRDLLGKALAELEGGYHSVITATGIAAIDLVMQLVPRDGLVIAPFDSYGGTFRLLNARAKQGHYRVKFVDLSDLAQVEKAFTEKVALVLIETPTNPIMRIVDLAAVVALAKKNGALVAVDNTFLPVAQKPLELGADFSIHSTTKYINGHGDIVGGAVISRTKELHDKCAWWANVAGVTGAPFDSYLTLRGLRTLAVRMERQSKSTEVIAAFLEKHPGVAKVYYPGFPHHPGHELAKKQQTCMGAMLSFELKGDVRVFLETLCKGDSHLFTLAVSLGGFESLAAHPATMSHASMTPEARAAAGIGDKLVRLSIGLEAPEDLQAALQHALEKAA